MYSWEPYLLCLRELLQRPGRISLPVFQVSSKLPANSTGVRADLFLMSWTVDMCPQLSLHLSSPSLSISFHPCVQPISALHPMSPPFHFSLCSRCERVTCEFTRDPASCFSLPLRISFYNISLPTNAPVPADVFRMGPSNSVPGDEMLLKIASGDEEGYFAVQQQAYGGVISLRRALSEPRDFFLTVEMRLIRYGTAHLYMAKIAVFVTHEQPSRAFTPLPYSSLSNLQGQF